MVSEHIVPFQRRLEYFPADRQDFLAARFHALIRVSLTGIPCFCDRLPGGNTGAAVLFFHAGSFWQMREPG